MKTLLLALLASSGVVDPEISQEFADLKVVFTLEGVEDVSVLETDGSVLGAWQGSFGSAPLQLAVLDLDMERFGLETPEDVVDMREANFDAFRAERDGAKHVPFRFQEVQLLEGPFGALPYGYLGIHTDYEGTKPVAHTLCLGGVGESLAYSIEIDVEGPLGAEDKKALVESLGRCIRYSGPTVDPEWTDEELEARWKKSVPEKLHPKLVEIRTDHYLILSNCGKNTMKGFGKKMEEFYAAVKEVYPFEEVPGERLLPVFLFRTSQQYYEFCRDNLGWTLEDARESKGVASGDFYATWYEAPRDPVHIHEATHQLFFNRLRLRGGGSWFQEGVAEYMSTSKNDRKAFKKLVSKDKHTPLATFTAIPSLLMTDGSDRTDGGDDASERYLQAACVIEFVRRDKEWKGKFMDFVHAMGRARPNDAASIGRALGEVYGVDLKGFEERFLEYWGKG